MKALNFLLFSVLGLGCAQAQQVENEAVDLGLSVKWATMNVQASSMTDGGLYCGWGDPTGKKVSDNNDHYPSTSLAISGSEMDVATQLVGGNWRIPTSEEVDELRDKCLWVYTHENGVHGYKITGPNHNSIFLPIKGFRRGVDSYGESSFTFYSIGTGAGRDYNRSVLYLDSVSVCLSAIQPAQGIMVRPVLNEPVRKSEDVKAYPVTEGDFVDLKLSVKWASKNVGATQPEEAGDHYQWGLLEKDTLSTDEGWKIESSLRHAREESVIKNGRVDISGTAKDVAKKLNPVQQLPTGDEMQELIDRCTWVETVYQGVKGYRIVGRNGNSIFLPQTGIRFWGKFSPETEYWTSTPYDGGVKVLNLEKAPQLTYGDMCNSASIRPVTKK